MSIIYREFFKIIKFNKKQKTYKKNLIKQIIKTQDNKTYTKYNKRKVQPFFYNIIIL